MPLRRSLASETCAASDTRGHATLCPPYAVSLCGGFRGFLQRKFMTTTLVSNWFGEAFNNLHPMLQVVDQRGGKLNGTVHVEIPKGLSGAIGKRLAKKLGVPPMGGVAFGLDRIVTFMCEKWDSIRDVIAFPKTQRGQDLLVETPSVVTEKQLRELHIKLRGAATN